MAEKLAKGDVNVADNEDNTILKDGFSTAAIIPTFLSSKEFLIHKQQSPYLTNRH